jgi:hypothetical protein
MKMKCFSNIQSKETSPKTSPKCSPRNPISFNKLPFHFGIKDPLIPSSALTSPKSEKPKLLHQLKSRSLKSSEALNPEIVASVVKQYVLPMFESDLREKKRYFSNHQRKFSTDNSAYGSCKLSEQLTERIEELNSTVLQMKKEKEEAIQEKELLAKESQWMKSELEREKANMAAVMSENLKLHCDVTRVHFTLNFLMSQAKSYKKLYEDAGIKIREEKRKIAKLKAENDIRLYSIKFP